MILLRLTITASGLFKLRALIRRTAASSEADDFRTRCPPRKMIEPSLPSRMKERDLLPRVEVDAMRFRPLMLIAQLTGEAEIIVV